MSATHALVLLETCCSHFQKVLGAGTREEMEELALEVELTVEQLDRGCHVQVTEVGRPAHWDESGVVEGVTVNGEPAVWSTFGLIRDGEVVWSSWGGGLEDVL